MGDIESISVNIPLDEEGMIGKECLECERYFKLKPGTGLPTSYCHCPYCDYEGESDTFWTKAQLEYAKSIAINKAHDLFVKPSLDNLKKSFKELERSSRNSFLQFKVSVKSEKKGFRIQHYSEEELETKITCDNCNLEFAIYGVFSKCPDCNELNAFLIYEKSLEVTLRKLQIFSNPEIPADVLEQSLSSVLTSCISAFDGLGKELRKRKPSIYPAKPKNIFQNLYLLNENLDHLIEKEHSEYQLLLKSFQARHLYEHNMGVIDQDFVTKLPEYSSQIGRKYKLTINELNGFIDAMKKLGDIIKSHFVNSND